MPVEKQQNSQMPRRRENIALKPWQREAEGAFHDDTAQEQQNARSAEKQPDWQEEFHIQGRALDKKKPFLVGNKNQGFAFRQHSYQRPEKPIGNGANKAVRQHKPCRNRSH